MISKDKKNKRERDLNQFDRRVALLQENITCISGLL